MPEVISAPDKWRGSATAGEVAAAVAAAAGRNGWTVDVAPVSDGGEGFVDVLGGPNRVSRVHGPDGRMLDAEWRMDGLDAFIEMARASGLSLAGGPERNDTLAAGALGTGELVSEALAAGAQRIVVGLGGSASTDGGLGCVELLRDDRRLRSVELIGACEVDLGRVALSLLARNLATVRHALDAGHGI
ncbi:MAG: glycerate kinase [Actinobacteria bacterium]|nr:glycerate kinase [Actinomycetota bacterium]